MTRRKPHEPAQPDCQVSDAVLAHFLDGEAQVAVNGADGWLLTWTADELAQHRADCPQCDSALARARRLDAFMAAGVDSEVDHVEAEAWLDAAVAANEMAGPKAMSIEEISAIDWDHVEGRSRSVMFSSSALLAVGGTLLAVGLVVGLVLDLTDWSKRQGDGGNREANRGRSSQAGIARPSAATGTSSPDTPTHEIQVARLEPVRVEGESPRIAEPRLPGARTAPAGIELSEPSEPALEPALDPLVAKRSASHGLIFDDEPLPLPDRIGSERRFLRPVAYVLRLPSVYSGRDVARCKQILDLPVLSGPLGFSMSLGLRRTAYERLLRSEHPAAHRLLIDRAAGLEAGAELQGLVSRLRDMPVAVSSLRHRLRNHEGDMSAMRAAARIGGVRLDVDLRAAVDNEQSRADEVALALVGVDRRSGGVELLMGLWSDLDVRDRLLDEFMLVQRWFGKREIGGQERGFGSEAVDVLIETLDQSSSAPVRRRCMLALGALKSNVSSPALIDIVSGRRHDEAGIAAFALGQLHAGIDELVDLIDSDWRPLRRRSYLMAAAASRCERAASRWIRRMRLSEEEKRFLLTGKFGIEQIPIAASLFHDRYVSGY